MRHPVIIVRSAGHEEDEGLVNAKVYVTDIELLTDLETQCGIVFKLYSFEWQDLIRQIESADPGSYIQLNDSYQLLIVTIV